MVDETLQAVPATDTIYIVQQGDSLSKIAERFYGDATRYPLIAEYNRINPQSALYIGSRLVIPARDTLEEIAVTATRVPAVELPSSPGGSVPAEHNGQRIETVEVSASRLTFWHDWRFWLAIGGVAALVWFLSRSKRS